MYIYIFQYISHGSTRQSWRKVKCYGKKNRKNKSINVFSIYFILFHFPITSEKLQDGERNRGKQDDVIKIGNWYQIYECRCLKIHEQQWHKQKTKASNKSGSKYFKENREKKQHQRRKLPEKVKKYEKNIWV